MDFLTRHLLRRLGRHCPHCKQWFFIEEFYSREQVRELEDENVPVCSDGEPYYSRCRSCRNEATRRYRIRMAEVPNTLTLDEWHHILKQWDYRCVKCGTDENISLDHLIPISKGGHHAWYNVIPLCRSCNSSKGAKDYRIFFGLEY